MARAMILLNTLFDWVHVLLVIGSKFRKTIGNRVSAAKKRSTNVHVSTYLRQKKRLKRHTSMLHSMKVIIGEWVMYGI